MQGQTDGCNGVRYNLTADIIESIFRTYPAGYFNFCQTVKLQQFVSRFWVVCHCELLTLFRQKSSNSPPLLNVEKVNDDSRKFERFRQTLS